MTPGRNDPCPCGSGRKYKRCCLKKERKKERNDATFGRRGLAPPVPDVVSLGRAREVPEWEADVFPLPIRFDEDPTARPVVVVVMAGDVAVYTELLERLGGESEDVASLLADAIVDAADRVGAMPEGVSVRHGPVAYSLSERLAGRGVTIRCELELPATADFGRLMLREVFDRDLWPPVSGPVTWEGWGHPDESIGRLFEAAAAFHRASPWRRLSDSELLEIDVADGDVWTAAVLGGAGQEFGLALYEYLDDLELTATPFDAPGGPPPLDELVGRVLSLTFDAAEEIPREMRKEVAGKGWPVASPSAYPVLMLLNTPGGGLSSRDLADLTTALQTVAELAEHLEEGGGLPEEGWWEDASGARLYVEGEVSPPLWEPPGRLEPGGPEGPNADPEAPLRGGADPDLEALRIEGEAVADRFAHHLEDGRGFGRATVEKHASNVALFCEFLTSWEGAPPAAVHERDLLTFLFDWYVRKVRDAEVRAEAMPVSLSHFFRFLAEEEGVECPWAEDVLSEREAYRTRRETFPGGFWWDSGVGSWIWRLEEDLDRRIMTPDETIGDSGMSWRDPGKAGQATLHRELERRWLLWRDEEIRKGVTDPHALREALVRRQRAWERSPHPDHRERTPVQVVERERRLGR